MNFNPEEWPSFLAKWTKEQVQIIIENRWQILQVFASMVLFLLFVGSLQYIPFLVDWLHISNKTFGKIVVYSLPFWVLVALFLVWRS